MKIQVMVFWVVKPCNDVAGYQCFGGSCCLQFNLNMEAAWSSKSLVSYHIIEQCYNSDWSLYSFHCSICKRTILHQMYLIKPQGMNEVFHISFHV